MVWCMWFEGRGREPAGLEIAPRFIDIHKKCIFCLRLEQSAQQVKGGNFQLLFLLDRTRKFLVVEPNCGRQPLLQHTGSSIAM